MSINFSETYYPTIQGYRLTPEQHKANNQWFAEMLDKLKDDGVLYIPVLHKSFNKQGDEVEVRDMTDKEYWNSPEIKELLTK